MHTSWDIQLLIRESHILIIGDGAAGAGEGGGVLVAGAAEVEAGGNIVAHLRREPRAQLARHARRWRRPLQGHLQDTQDLCLRCPSSRNSCGWTRVQLMASLGNGPLQTCVDAADGVRQNMWKLSVQVKTLAQR